jgi:hypothetical protein
VRPVRTFTNTGAPRVIIAGTLRLDLEAVEELVRQLAGEAVSHHPNVGTSHGRYWRSAAVRAWARP